MTDEQRQNQKMRYQGFGYKQIANTIGISRDMIRDYCKQKWVAWFCSWIEKGIP